MKVETASVFTDEIMVLYSSWKINGETPFILGNTHISLEIEVVFPLILSKFLYFVLFREVSRNISPYICLLSRQYNISRKFSAYLYKNQQ